MGDFCFVLCNDAISSLELWEVGTGDMKKQNMRKRKDGKKEVIKYSNT